MTDSQTILQQIKKAVLTVDPGAELILFGSRARGDYNEESDWDVLVLSENNIDLSFKDKISNQLFPIGLEYSETITPVIVNRNNWYHKYKDYPLFYEVKKDGKRI